MPGVVLFVAALGSTLDQLQKRVYRAIGPTLAVWRVKSVISITFKILIGSG